MRKLELYRAGGSDKHLRDIRGMLAAGAEPLQHDWIEATAAARGLTLEGGRAREPEQ